MGSQTITSLILQSGITKLVKLVTNVPGVVTCEKVSYNSIGRPESGG